MPNPAPRPLAGDSDEELARQCQAGSLSAFETLVVRNQTGVYRFLLSCTRNEADARDLAQATFVAAYRAIESYRPSLLFAPWLFTIARRKFLDLRRRTRPAIPLAYAEEPMTSCDPAENTADREDRRQLWDRIRGLVSADQFAALWLHYHDDLELKGIANVLGRTQTSVKVLLFRARQTLSRHLDPSRTIHPVATHPSPAWSITARPQPPLPKSS